MARARGHAARHGNDAFSARRSRDQGSQNGATRWAASRCNSSTPPTSSIVSKTKCCCVAFRFVVLTDRYIYSAIARAEVRGIDSAWIRSIYSMAFVPDAVFYLRISSPQHLVKRVVSSGRGFDYWESGMDLHLGEDFHDSFIAYQTRMLKVFDRMSTEYGFHVLNASRSVRSVGQTCAGQLQKSLTSVRLPKKKSAYYRQ